MAHDEALAERVRDALGARSDVEEKRMFGSLAFMVAGKLACCVTDDGLIVRVGRGEADALIASEPGARPFDMNGRPMRNWVRAAPEATAGDGALERWVERGVLAASAAGGPRTR